jgi:hypothetical protein
MIEKDITSPEGVAGEVVIETPDVPTPFTPPDASCAAAGPDDTGDPNQPQDGRDVDPAPDAAGAKDADPWFELQPETDWFTPTRTPEPDEDGDTETSMVLCLQMHLMSEHAMPFALHLSDEEADAVHLTCHSVDPSHAAGPDHALDDWRFRPGLAIARLMIAIEYEHELFQIAVSDDEDNRPRTGLGIPA